MTSYRERRYRKLTFRVTEAEHRTLSASARRAGLEFSAYARELLLKAKPPRAARKPAVEAVLLTQALSQLGTIATALQPLGDRSYKRLGSSGAMMPFLQRELVRTLHELRSCRTELLRALGRKAGSA